MGGVTWSARRCAGLPYRGHMDDLAAAYLTRLGVADPGSPSAQNLRALHVAHLDRVAYETVGIALGRPVGIDPVAAVTRIVAGWGGYCYHLNGAFAWLLDHLGYAVTRHVGGVQFPGSAPAVDGNHLALTVDVDGERWLVDVGLGNGPVEPIPLRECDIQQRGFRYSVRRSDIVDGWRFEQDPRLTAYPGMDFEDEAAHTPRFVPMHTRLSTDPASVFVSWVTVQRRTVDAVLTTKNCLSIRVDGEGEQRETLDTPARYWTTVREVLGFDPPDLTAGERDALWRRIWSAHQAWLTARGR